MGKAVVNNSTVIHGDKLHLYYNDEPIAFGTSCSIDISAETVDTSNKMSGNWKEFMTGQLSYTISSESLMTYTIAKDVPEGSGEEKGDLSGLATYTDLLEAMLTRAPIKFEMGTAKSAEEDYGIDAKFLSGSAVITSLNMTAQSGQICTCSVSLQGSGKLTPLDGLKNPASAQPEDA